MALTCQYLFWTAQLHFGRSHKRQDLDYISTSQKPQRAINSWLSWGRLLEKLSHSPSLSSTVLDAPRWRHQPCGVTRLIWTRQGGEVMALTTMAGIPLAVQEKPRTANSARELSAERTDSCLEPVLLR